MILKLQRHLFKLWKIGGNRVASFFMLFWLGHLIGDFVLQTNKIAYLKSQSNSGLLIHIALVCIAQMTVMSIYGYRGIIAAIICSIAHYFVDLFKIHMNKKGYLETGLFLLDQFLHALILLMISFFFGKTEMIFPVNLPNIRIAVILLFAIYAGSVLVVIVLRDFVPSRRNGSFFRHGERLLDAGFVFLIMAMVINILPIDMIGKVSIYLISIGLYGVGQMKYCGYSFKSLKIKLLVMHVIFTHGFLMYNLLGQGLN